MISLGQAVCILHEHVHIMLIGLISSTRSVGCMQSTICRHRCPSSHSNLKQSLTQWWLIQVPDLIEKCRTLNTA